MDMSSKLQGKAAESELAKRVEELTRAVEALQKPSLNAAEPVGSTRGLEEAKRPIRVTRPSLPQPRLLRRIIRHRQMRGKFFDANLFADPAWDMLLDLAAAREEGRRVSVTSLCLASQVPATTALRWISEMVESGVFLRRSDTVDRRRAFVELSEASADAMARYFAEIEVDTR